MTLMEVITALAIILILISLLIGVGSYVQTRADIDLTKGTLEALCSALTQYYDIYHEFPFKTDLLDSDTDGYWLDEFLGEYTVSQGTIPSEMNFETSAALFYFLYKEPSSRAIVEALPNSLITNKDMGGVNIRINLIASGQTIDLPRYIDPWEMSIRYEYLSGTAFPVLTSAGPDKIFDTPDDITSK